MRILNLKIGKSALGNEDFLVASSLFLVAIFYTYKFLFTGDGTVPYSFDYTIYPMYAHYQQNTLVEYSQFPLWSNMFQMGYPIYADWSSSLFYPFTTPFFFTLGPVQGLKVILLVHVFLSGIGFWYFSKLLTHNKLARYFGALMFMLCGALAGRMGVGHLNHILPFPWIPITMYFLHNALETRRFKYALFSMISMSFFILASVALFMFFAFLFAVYAIFQVFGYDKNKKIKLTVNSQKLIILCIIVIFSFLIFAIKFIPILNYSGGDQRPHPALYSSAGLGDLFSFFVDQSPVSDIPVGLSYSTSYYYLGLIPFIFLPFSIFHTSPHKKYLTVSLVVFLLWAMGYFTVFGAVHLVSIFQNLSVPPRSLIVASFCMISLMVLGFDWFMENYNGLSSTKKKYVWLFFGSICVVIFFEMITPFAVYLLIPDNYSTYRFFTKNEFTTMTLIASILTILTLLFIILRVFYKTDIKGFLLKILNPKTFWMNLKKAMGNTTFISTFLVVFVTVNLLVVNSTRLETRPVWYHQDKLEDKIADDIKADDPQYHPWLNDSYYDLVDSHLMSYENPMYSAGVAGWLRFHEHYYPGNITIGNMTYVPFNYEITEEVNKQNATIIKEYNVIKKPAYERDEEFEDAEPTSLSDIFSHIEGENESEPERITLYLYRLNNTLPDVFIVRDDLVIPLNVTELTPHKIVVKAEAMRSGDTVVFKNSWYPGWKYSLNSGEKKDTQAYQRLVSFDVNSDLDDATITFTFEPSDFVIGMIVTLMFFPAIVILYVISRKGYLKFLVTGKKP